MKEYCLSEVQNGNYTFPCPDRSCSRVWEYFLVRHVACLDDETRSDIEKHLADNYISQGRGFQQCPGCRTWCTPLNQGDTRLQCPACSRGADTGTFDFCWACQRQWRRASSMLECGNPDCDGSDPRIRILAAAERESGSTTLRTVRAFEPVRGAAC